MHSTRRCFIKKTIILSAYILSLSLPKISLGDWLASNFSRQAIDPALKQLFPDKILATSKKIHLKLPKVAENGSVVPITITCSIPKVDTIYIFSEKNPVPLVAKFSLDPDLETYIGARFKMQKTCDVIVIVHADNQYYQARQKVKVTLGGCGG